MSTAYNLLTPADAQLISYEITEEEHYRCQIMTIIGMTETGFDMVISKIDTAIVAILADSHAREIYHDEYAPERMTAEEILARIGFVVSVKEEVMVS